MASFLHTGEKEPRELVTSLETLDDQDIGDAHEPRGGLTLKVLRTVVGLCYLFSVSAIVMCQNTVGAVVGNHIVSSLQTEMPEYFQAAMTGVKGLDRPLLLVTYGFPVLLALGFGGLGLTVAACFLLFPCTTFSLSTGSYRSCGLSLCGLVLAVLLTMQSMSLAADYEHSMAQLLDFVQRCSSEACRDLAESRSTEWFDCLARGQYGRKYRPAFASNRGRWSDSCPMVNTLHCSLFECGRNEIVEQWDKYVVGQATLPECPCNTAEINDLVECKQAFEAYAKSNMQWIEPEGHWEGVSGCQVKKQGKGQAMTFNSNPCNRAGHSFATPVCALADFDTIDLVRMQREERCGVPVLPQFDRCEQAPNYALDGAADELKSELSYLVLSRTVQGTILVPTSVLLAALLWRWDACCLCRYCVPCKSLRTAAWPFWGFFMQVRAWFRLQAWLVQQHMQERESGQRASSAETLQFRTMTAPLAGDPELQEG